jgi:hypothetical protein
VIDLPELDRAGWWTTTTQGESKVGGAEYRAYPVSPSRVPLQCLAGEWLSVTNYSNLDHMEHS